MSGNNAPTAAPEAPGSGDALILDSVSFVLGPGRLGNVSMQVASGEIVGLLGPRGAGKTSLLRVISGESKPFGGKIWTHQVEITHLGARGRQDAGVFVCFHDHRRVRANRSMLEIMATAVDRQPQVLVVDEPFQRLEDKLRRQVSTALLKTCRDEGIGVLITSHEVREALNLVDRAYVIYEGKIMVSGTTDFLLRDPNL